MLIRGVSLITKESWSLRNSISLWMVMKVRSERLNNDMKNRKYSLLVWEVLWWVNKRKRKSWEKSQIWDNDFKEKKHPILKQEKEYTREKENEDSKQNNEGYWSKKFIDKKNPQLFLWEEESYEKIHKQKSMGTNLLQKALGIIWMPVIFLVIQR